jgi:GNAT superfamily N-acetyltransferase
MNDLLKDTIETDRLIISEAVLDECDALEKVLQSWSDKMLIEGSGPESGYFKKCLTEGDLPPIDGASRDNYRLKSIYIKGENKIIGYFDLYFGYPSTDCVWISIFVIDEAFRKKGYAQETIKYLSNDFQKNGFSKMGIGVFLNNWRALRFWTKAGFDKVSGINGDGDYQKNKYATIRLEKIV